MRWWTLLLVLVFLGAVTGCSTPQTRSQERSEAFERLSQADQRRVLDGQIRNGMREDAVYIALGRPGRILQGEDSTGGLVKWVYGSSYSRSYPAYTSRVVHDRRGRAYITDVYTPYTAYQRVDTFEVSFRNGRVVGWQEL